MFGIRQRALAYVAVALVVCGPATASAAPAAGGNRPPPAKMTVSPSSVAAGAVTTLAFKFQSNAAFSNMDAVLTIPAGWTTPVTTPATANGYVSVQKGTCTIPNTTLGITGSGPWNVTLHGVTCPFSKSFTISYAKTSRTVAGPSTFNATVNALAAGPVVVTVNPGAASRLTVTQQPGGARGGSAFTTQPKVAVTDAYGNVVTGNTSKVTLTKTGGTGGALFSCTTNPLAAVAGVASFAGCKIDKVGTGYVLHAVDGTLTATDTAPFAVDAGPGAKLVFSQQPGGAITSGGAFPTQPKVTVQDAGGNTATADSSTVTLSITGGTPTSGGPGVLSGCSQSESAGVVTFAGCAVTGTGTGYKLHAADGAMTPADSTAFAVVGGTATHLVFTQQPGGAATGGLPFPIQPQVTVLDASDNPVVGDVSTVTLTITDGTPAFGGPGTLSGCTQTESAGVVTFAGCTIDATGVGYRLHAVDGALTPTDSDFVVVGTGPPAAISLMLLPNVVAAHPGSGTLARASVTDAGGNGVPGETVVFTSDPAVTPGTVVDHGEGTYDSFVATTAAGTHDVTATVGAFHDTKTFTVHSGATANVTLSLDPTTVAAGAPSTATVTVTDQYLNPVRGRVVDVTGPSGLQVGTVTDNGDGTYTATVSADDAGGYLVTATADLVADSKTLTVTSGVVDSVSLALDPDTVSADTGSTTATATVRDAYGNLLAGETVLITSPTATVGTVTDNGDGTYTATVSADAATTYDVTAADGTTYDTKTLTVTPGAANELALVTDPETVAAGDGTTAKVSVIDAHGNGVPGEAVDVTSATASVGTVTDNGDGTYAATVSATVAGLHFVHAELGGLSDDASFTVTPGAPAALTFTQSPGGVPLDCPPFVEPYLCYFYWLVFGGGEINGGEAFFVQPAVGVLDAYGNTVTTDSTTLVSLSITPGTGTAGAALTCLSASVTAAGGLAYFDGCEIDKAALGYTLRAESPGLTAADSAPFDVTAGDPEVPVVSLDPDTITADGVDASTVTVTLADSAGNPVTGAGLDITTDPAGTVGGITDNGDGTYTAAVTVTEAGDHVISASVFTLFGPGLPGTATLHSVPGPPAAAYLNGPDDQETVVGQPFAAEFAVCLTDDLNHPVAAGTLVDFTSDPANPAGATFSGPAYTDALGCASATGTANTVTGSYTTTVTSGSATTYFNSTNLPDVPYEITNKSGDSQGCITGWACHTPLSLTVVDQYGNPVPGVTVAFAAPSSSPTATLSDTEPVTDAQGTVSVTAQADFGLGTYQVTATVDGGTPSTTFTLTNDS